MTKHFPSDFYVTCATVIPVLFLAAAVQGGPYKLLLRASMAATRATAAVSKVSRRRALPAFARSSLIRFTAYTIVVAGVFGEVNALTALYRGSEQPGQRTLVLVLTLILLIAVISGPLWEYAQSSVAQETVLEAARKQREGRSE